MSKRHRWAEMILGALLAAACGCKGESRSLAAVDNICDVPCEDDPSKTCSVPCPPNAAAAGLAQGSGAGGAGGLASGGAGAGGAAIIDVPGTVVEFTTTEFDQTAPYLQPITIAALGSVKVQADALDGSFTLVGASAEPQWVLAKDLDGGGGAFSTYSVHNLSDPAGIAVEVVLVDLIDSIATQIDAPNLITGSAHVVLAFTDQNQLPLDGVELVIPGASIGYAVGPQIYSGVAASTGTTGLAAAINVPVSGPSTVAVTISLGGALVDPPVLLQMAPDTVTFARIQLLN